MRPLLWKAHCWMKRISYRSARSVFLVVTQFIRPGEKGLILEVIPLRFVHSKLAGETLFRAEGRLSGRRFVELKLLEINPII
jgi:hypothetical protein